MGDLRPRRKVEEEVRATRGGRQNRSCRDLDVTAGTLTSTS